MPAGDNTLLTDGSLDWSGGVDSLRPPTIASEANPEGLPRNFLAWLENGTVRSGGISQRPTWQPKGAISGPGAAIAAIMLGTYLSQGYTMYSPVDGSTPYLIAIVGGHVLKVDVDFVNPPVDLSNIYDFFLDPNQPKCFFCQAENYLVIQDGSLQTLPLIWNGATLAQSNGITGITAIGQPVPSTYQLTALNAFRVPAVGQTSSPINLSAPYPGNLGDNVTVTAYQGAVSTALGTFIVSSVGPLSISLTTVSTGVSGTTYTVPLPLTLQLAVNANSPANVALGVGNWTVPAIGKTVTLGLTTQYPGSVGDQITVMVGATLVGTFSVTNITLATLTIKAVTLSVNAGTTFAQPTLVVTVNSVRNFSFIESTSEPFTIPNVGENFLIYFPKNSMPYSGRQWDLVSLKCNGVLVGTFRVLATNYTPAPIPFLYQVQLETVSTTYAGYTFNMPNVNLTVVLPTPNPFSLEVGGGTWTIPAVGFSVSLGIFWNYPSGYAPPQGGNSIAYPGSVGDTVNLYANINETGNLLGTFLVTQFDQFGGITLQTISSAYVGTTFSGSLIGSMSITGAPSTTATTGINQIPAAGPMVYFQGRIWYAINDTVFAGDIVGGPSGTSANGFVDSVLSVTESPLVLGGDGFKMPLNPGGITGLAVSANLDASLGQGNLLIGTPNYVFSLQVPITRQQWISTTSANAPQVNVVQIGNGWTGQDSIVAVNGDLFYYDLEPQVRSLIWAIRYFQQWGNIPISSNEERALNKINPALLPFASGIYFDNRLLITGQPVQTAMGVVHNSVLPLDFTPIATLTETLPPCWEGEYEGFQVLKLVTANFGGMQRAFAICLSQNESTPGAIELWEISTNGQFENGTQRVKWRVEFPAFTAGEEFDLKQVRTLELWVDKIFGKVDFLLEFRPDGETCWQKWYAWSKCIDTGATDYPPQTRDTGFAETWTMPEIPSTAETQTGRPNDQGYQFQPRLTITGYCRIRALMLFMSECKRQLTYNIPTPNDEVPDSFLS